MCIRDRFDIVIIDPPSFARRAFETERALSAYKKLTDLGVRLVQRGGLLVQSSCSSRVTADDFYATVARAAALADAQFGLLKLGGDRSSAPVVVANIPELPALPALREATATHSEVGFTYHGTPRRLQPYALLLRERYWYVIGHDIDRDEVRTYRVDRLESELEVGAPGAFERPAGFDPRTTFPADPKLLGDEPRARAHVLVDQPRAEAIERELGASAVLERRDDGSVVVDVACANLDAFQSWLFGLGEHAEVLAPAEVRAGVIDWLEAMVAK